MTVEEILQFAIDTPEREPAGLFVTFRQEIAIQILGILRADAALRAENARLTSEVERLRVVAEAARACYDSEDEWSLCITSPPCGACKPCALKAALDAAGGEGKR